MTRRQLLLTSTAVRPFDVPAEPEGWYGAVDDGVLTLPDEFCGESIVEVSYQHHADRDRRRRGRVSDARVKVITPA